MSGQAHADSQIIAQVAEALHRLAHAVEEQVHATGHMVHHTCQQVEHVEQQLERQVQHTEHQLEHARQLLEACERQAQRANDGGHDRWACQHLRGEVQKLESALRRLQHELQQARYAVRKATEASNAQYKAQGVAGGLAGSIARATATLHELQHALEQYSDEHGLADGGYSRAERLTEYALELAQELLGGDDGDHAEGGEEAGHPDGHGEGSSAGGEGASEQTDKDGSRETEEEREWRNFEKTLKQRLGKNGEVVLEQVVVYFGTDPDNQNAVSYRRADFFLPEQNELYEAKHGYDRGGLGTRGDWQAIDYGAMADSGGKLTVEIPIKNNEAAINTLSARGVSLHREGKYAYMTISPPEINYVFSSQSSAAVNAVNTFGAASWFLDSKGNMQLLK